MFGQYTKPSQSILSMRTTSQCQRKSRASITEAFGFEPVLINSALVSAQNRQRLYWVGKRNDDGTYSKVDVKQPEDRGILLRDVLDSAVAWQEKAYALTTRCQGAIPEDTLTKHRHTMCAEPVEQGNARYLLKNLKYADEKSGTLTACCYKGIGADGMYTVAEPVRIGCYPSPDGTIKNSQGMRLYGIGGKSVNITAQGGGMGAKTGLYAVPVLQVPEATKKGFTEIAAGDCVDLTQPNSKTRRGRNMRDKCNCVMTGCAYYQYCGTIDQPIYEVKNGLITIKGQAVPYKTCRWILHNSQADC